MGVGIKITCYFSFPARDGLFAYFTLGVVGALPGKREQKNLSVICVLSEFLMTCGAFSCISLSFNIFSSVFNHHFPFPSYQRHKEMETLKKVQLRNQNFENLP